MATVHTQLRQNVAPFFDATTFTPTDATVSTSAIVDGNIHLGTTVPAGVTVTIVELTGSTDTPSATNTHDLTSTSPADLALKPGKYRVEVKSDDTNITVLDGASTTMHTFTINVSIAANELKSVIPDTAFTPAAPTTEGATANTGKIVFDSTTHPIAAGFDLVYYKKDPTGADAPGSAANPGTTFTSGTGTLEATGLTPGDY